MIDIQYLTQAQLAVRWQVAESTLERWRSEGIGPIYLKMMGRVRYRLSDILAFEAESLRKSTSESYTTCNSTRGYEKALSYLAGSFEHLRTPEGYFGLLLANANLVAKRGIEPRTRGFSVRCSTN